MLIKFKKQITVVKHSLPMRILLKYLCKLVPFQNSHRHFSGPGGFATPAMQTETKGRRDGAVNIKLVANPSNSVN